MIKHNMNQIASLVCSVVILFYSRAYIDTLSYYAVILALYMLALLLLYDGGKRNAWKLFWAGMFLGGVIIINPYFVIAVLASVVGVYIYDTKKRMNSKVYLLSFMFGLFVCAGFACYLVLRNNSIAEIIASMAWWTEGDTHMFGVGNWWMAFVYVAARFKFTIIPSALCVIYSLIITVKRKITDKKSAVIFAISFVLFTMNCLIDRLYEGTIHTNLAIFGLQVFIITQKKQWDIFRCFYLPGLTLAFFMSLSSDTGFSAMSVGFALSGGVSCIIICNYVSEILKKRRDTVLAVCGMLSLAVAVLLSGVYRIMVVYRDSDLMNLNVKIEEGPAKGLFTSAEHYEQYMQVLAVMDQYCSGEGNVLILSLCPWAYLCTDMRCGAYTTWRIKMDRNDEKLNAYYEQHPDRIPNVVIELNDNIGNYDLTENPQYDPERYNSFLWQYMEDNSYEKITVECGYVWLE